jgi:hypothetical protein
MVPAMNQSSEWVANLCELPQLQELPTDPWVKLVSHACRKARAPDEILDVHEIPRAVDGNHARGQLQLDETRHGQEREVFTA